ncbi:hypothetical protein A2U01_0026920, partial [Trifolium medium]|nr:hypothetical protein [Trifolium medium]
GGDGHLAGGVGDGEGGGAVLRRPVFLVLAIWERREKEIEIRLM